MRKFLAITVILLLFATANNAFANGSNKIWLMDGFTKISSSPIDHVADLSWEMAGTGDFNGDGKSDILWRNSSTGQNGIWMMSGLTRSGGGLITPVADLNWKIAGAGDFNGDGKSDILWRNSSTGQNAIWIMNGLTRSGGGLITPVADLKWEMAGAGDFNGDGKSDILWRHSASGKNGIWLMNGFTVSGSSLITPVVDMNWGIKGVGDFNTDGKADIIWRHAASGKNGIWLMNGFAQTGASLITRVDDLSWDIAGAGDFNGDRKADLLWRKSGSSPPPPPPSSPKPTRPSPPPPPSPSPPQTPSPPPTPAPPPSGGSGGSGGSGSQCEGTGTFLLNKYPVDINYLETVVPLGRVFGGHVLPTDHQYLQGTPGDIYAPADGYVIKIQRMPDDPSTGQTGDFHMILEFSCSYHMIFIHVTSLSDKIYNAVAPITGYKYIRVPISEGEVLGTHGTSLDLSIFDKDVTLTGFVNPSRYMHQIHTVDPNEYFVDSIKSQIIAKMNRTAAPIGGKIDYDIDGKLIGGWFHDDQNAQTPAWWGELAIVYNHQDNYRVIFSYFDPTSHEPRQYAVKGNLPDPANVTKDSGLIKYELTRIVYRVSSDSSYWRPGTYVGGVYVEDSDSLQIKATVLVEMIEDRKLKIEFFPGATADQVNQFTASALVYER